MIKPISGLIGTLMVLAVCGVIITCMDTAKLRHKEYMEHVLKACQLTALQMPSKHLYRYDWYDKDDMKIVNDVCSTLY